MTRSQEVTTTLKRELEKKQQHFLRVSWNNKDGYNHRPQWADLLLRVCNTTFLCVHEHPWHYRAGNLVSLLSPVAMRASLRRMRSGQCHGWVSGPLASRVQRRPTAEPSPLVARCVIMWLNVK